jgi:predicted nucleic acid-binding protein
MNLVDSSGWLEYFANGQNANYFAAPIQDTNQLLVPAICMYEVFKRVSLEQGEDEALRSMGVLGLGTEVELNRDLAITAAQISLEYKLAMADSIIYATARAYDATLWTQDQHFENLPGVRYIDKK